MAENVTIEPYRPGDEVGINELFKEVFGETRDLAGWRWKFVESPIDSRPFILLAKHDGRIVGQYASVVAPLKYGDRTAIAALPVDNMIHPDYRGGVSGTQVKLFTRSRKLWTRADCDVVWGFPNPTAYKVGKRLLEYEKRIEIVNLCCLLGWRVAARKILNLAPTTAVAEWIGRRYVRARLTARTRTGSGIECRSVDTFDERADALWQRVRQTYPIAVERTRDHLNWRYAKNPDARYDLLQAERGDEVVGLIVSRCRDMGPERIGFLLDCLVIDEPGTADLLPALVSHALLRLSAQGADYALARFAAGDPMRRRFERLGFRHRPGVWDEVAVYKEYSDVMVDDVVQDASNWLISFGDCESL